MRALMAGCCAFLGVLRGRSGAVLPLWLAGVLVSAAAGRVNGQGLENVQFRIGTAKLAWDEQLAQVGFSLSDLPSGAGIRGFGFVVFWNSNVLSFRSASVPVAGPHDIYLLDQYSVGELTYLRLEVFFGTPLARGSDAVLLTFCSAEEEFCPVRYAEYRGDVRDFIPISLQPGIDTWISVEGYAPLNPVSRLVDGGVAIYRRDCIEFGEGIAAQGETVDVPVLLTNILPLQTIAVGVDYDEDMLELLAVRVANESDPSVTALSYRRIGATLWIHARLDPRFTMLPRAGIPVAVMRFFVKPAAPAGVRTPIRMTQGWYDGDRALATVETGGVDVLESTAHFMRGDVNRDGRINTSDAVSILSYLFNSGHGLPCPDAADVDDDGTINLADATRLLGYVFTGAPLPKPPFPGMGLDPTYDTLPPCQ